MKRALPPAGPSGGSESHGRDPRRPGRKRGVRGEQAQFHLPGEGPHAPFVPALRRNDRRTDRSTAGGRDGASGRRRWRNKGRRRVRRGRPQFAEIPDGAIGQVLAEVVTVLGRRWRRDGMVVLEQGRHELVGLAAVEAVPPLEAAPARPRSRRGAAVGLVLGGQVPLAHRHRQVAGRPRISGRKPLAPGDRPQ